jgi:thioredoxin reductase
MRPGRVTSVTANGLGFRISVNDEEVILARAVIVATGVRDLLPQIEGISARWGRDVVHCPYCHGWEIRDQRIGLVATGPMSALQALMFHQWSDHVQFFTEGLPFSDADLGKLAALGIPVTVQPIRRVVVEADRLVGAILEDGSGVDLDALAVPTRTTARLEGLEGLGLETTENAMGVSLVADTAGRTSAPGVWAAGNVVNGGQQVSEAAANGARVAMTLNTELVFQDADAAVVSTRALDEEKTA